MTDAAVPETEPAVTSDEASTPSRTVDFPIVGIGASAGGLSAFEAFFSGMPADGPPNMAFVLVQHLAPDHKSLLGDLLRHYTRMPVFEVEDGMPVRINTVYIIPPNHDLALLNGALQLFEPTEPRGQRLAIDYFFRSLAQDQQERAIGIVLSGTGSDGTLGVRAIKAEGGMVIAQTPATTEFDGMPQSALATGLVDHELPPSDMPAALLKYAAHAFGPHARATGTASPKSEDALRKVFILLRGQTGHDFSQYKSRTIHRRIDRRMAVHQLEALDDYVQFLQRTPAEVEALFRDLLIGVTAFFRDPEAFQALEHEVLPKLLAEKSRGSVFRVWSAGCSTGEEAYSLAILVTEAMETTQRAQSVQIFATDLDSRAILVARAGLYPIGIAADISPERLARFFTLEPDGSAYRVHKSLRDMLVFSEHDLIKDPPFSKLDLISCRNLLIYLGADLQKKLVPLFHYALNPRGVLFLGTSEGVGEFLDLFTTLDRKAKLFRRRDDVYAAHRAALGRFLPPMTAVEAATPRGAEKHTPPAKLPLRDLTEQALLQRLAPAAALVNRQGDVLYLHGRTGLYLEPAPGEAGINNILQMSREGLRLELSNALHRAASGGESVSAHCPRVKTNGHYTAVQLSVHPLTQSPAPADSPLFLVILEPAPTVEAPAPPAPGAAVTPADADLKAYIATLNQELRAKDEYLRSTHEELESSNEELKSANEELQSVNEELQSSNEELETAKEEMHSVNEELTTVNTELHTRVTELSRTNNDMNNLLSGTGIATVFVDRRLRIMRFTPTAAQLINLIPGDIGRPVGHLVTNLVDHERLAAEAQTVLDTLIPLETEVQARGGAWFMMRIRPYRTLDNVIEGAVITFVDISEMKRVEHALKQANELARLAVVVRDAHDAITVQDLEGRTLAWNPGAVRMYGWTEADALAMNVRERIPQGRRGDALAKVRELSRAEVLVPYPTQRLTKAGVTLDVMMTATALLNEHGEMYAIATTERAGSPNVQPTPSPPAPLSAPQEEPAQTTESKP